MAFRSIKPAKGIVVRVNGKKRIVRHVIFDDRFNEKNMSAYTVFFGIKSRRFSKAWNLCEYISG